MTDITKEFVPIGYREKSGTVFTITASPAAAANPLKDSYSDEEATAAYQLWGKNNDWPVTTRIKIEKSTTAAPLLRRGIQLYYGKGLRYWKESVNSDGIIIKDFSTIPEIDAFLLNNDIDYLMLERLTDFKFFGNVFCQFILNGAKSRIENIYHMEAEFTRFGEIDSKAKKITRLKYTSDWKKQTDTEDIPYLNRKDQNIVSIKVLKEKRFSTHDCFPSPGSTLYAIPPHFGLVMPDGWLDYAIGIPKLMNAINKNGMKLKYHVQIPADYWISVYPDYNQMTAKEKEKLRSNELDKMDEMLVSSESAYSSFISHYGWDPIQQKERPGWKITMIDDPIKKDQFLTSVQEADTQTARALMIDVSMSGIQTEGGKMGSGSGSDKRVAYTNAISMSYAETLIITAPLRLVQKINGWDPTIKFGFEYDLPTTLNVDQSGMTNNL